MSTNSESSKSASRPTGMGNPDELVKQAQRVLVNSSMSNKEENKAVDYAKGKFIALLCIMFIS